MDFENFKISSQVIDNKEKSKCLSDVLDVEISTDIDGLENICDFDFFYEQMIYYANSNSDDLSLRIKVFADILNKYKHANYSKLVDLIDTIIHDYNYEYFVLALENGHLRLEYLNALRKKVLEFEREHGSSIYDFVDFVENTRNFGIKYGTTIEHSSNDCVHYDDSQV